MEKTYAFAGLLYCDDIDFQVSFVVVALSPSSIRDSFMVILFIALCRVGSFVFYY